LFFKACDVQSLADRIIHMLKKRDMMAKMGKQGRQKALTYDWKLVTKEVVAYYKEVLGKEK
jgi:glycosyltransferase involved in cell wall biosynthesis